MYIKSVRFVWDSGKARRNSIKHGVGFKEAATAFDDPEGLLADDEEHSGEEPRQWLIGESAKGRVLVAVFTIRDRDIRIIIARPAEVEERRQYEENRNIPL